MAAGLKGGDRFEGGKFVLRTTIPGCDGCIYPPTYPQGLRFVFMYWGGKKSLRHPFVVRCSLCPPMMQYPPSDDRGKAQHPHPSPGIMFPGS